MDIARIPSEDWRLTGTIWHNHDNLFSVMNLNYTPASADKNIVRSGTSGTETGIVPSVFTS